MNSNTKQMLIKEIQKLISQKEDEIRRLKIKLKKVRKIKAIK